MSLTCRELVELLIDFVDGEMPPEQRKRLEDHICGCTPCDAYVQTYRLTVQVTRRLKLRPPALPPHLAERCRNTLAAALGEQQAPGQT
jgi:anti-sigma factor RsiW